MKCDKYACKLGRSNHWHYECISYKNFFFLFSEIHAELDLLTAEPVMLDVTFMTLSAWRLLAKKLPGKGPQ